MVYWGYDTFSGDKHTNLCKLDDWIYSPENERMSPENEWLEDVFSIEMVSFLGDMLVFGGVMNMRGLGTCFLSKLQKTKIAPQTWKTVFYFQVLSDI